MEIEHSMQFVKDSRNFDRVTPLFNVEIQKYNLNIPYSVQNEQMNMYN